MLRLRKQLTIAAAAIWAFWIIASMFGLSGWSTYPNEYAIAKFTLVALAQSSLWVGLACGTGALFTHILIVRDNELYEPADASGGCDCGCDADSDNGA